MVKEWLEMNLEIYTRAICKTHVNKVKGFELYPDTKSELCD